MDAILIGNRQTRLAASKPDSTVQLKQEPLKARRAALLGEDLYAGPGRFERSATIVRLHSELASLRMVDGNELVSRSGLAGVSHQR